MKQFILFLFCLMFSTGFLFAQNNKTIDWKITLTPVEGKENTYLFDASAKIEKGFHLFAADPGGDGFLIPTTIKFNGTAKPLTETLLERKGKIVSSEMEYVGMINYYENETGFFKTITFKNKGTFTGEIEFQSCNESMCFPPETVTFHFDIK